MVMGALRSCYAAPSFFGLQRPLGVQIWYWTDRCAGIFPFRHSFGSHYFFPKSMLPNVVGEQIGLRVYNKGAGPIGAPHAGITWKGELDWFIRGIPSPLPPGRGPCVNAITGDKPIPPPTTWAALRDPDNTAVPDWVNPFLANSNVGSYLDWWSLEEGISPTDPDARAAWHWHFEEGQGMVLDVSLTSGGIPPADLVRATFLGVTETPTVADWFYLVTLSGGGMFFFTIGMLKCIP